MTQRARDVEVTLATVADSADIAAVKVAGWRSTYAAWVPDTELAALTDPVAQAATVASALAEPPNFAVLARRRGALLGFALCLLRGRDEALLDSFHVVAEARGGGVGGALLRRVARELEHRGATTLALEVVEGNTRTRELYERLGGAYTHTAPARWAPRHVREAHYRWADLGPLHRA
jgi:ribosomal protein S18 acetylase RimI-like enzyme